MNIVTIKGDTLTFTETITTNGSSVDLTSASLVITTYSNGVLLNTKTITSFTQNRASVIFTSAETALWPVSTIECKSRLTLGNGKVHSDIVRYIECNEF